MGFAVSQRRIILPHCAAIKPTTKHLKFVSYFYPQSRVPKCPQLKMSSQPVKKVRIEVISDNVCPWCYVGKRKMEQAIQRMPPGVDFEVTWKPFYLNPNISEEGEDLREHLTSKYGEAMMKRFEGPNNPLSNAGRSVGINFTQNRRVVNTRDSHRLIEWSKQFGKQNQLIECLFKVYFEDGKDISKLDILVDVAKAAGLDESAARAFLQTENMKDEVDAECRSYSRKINGVPHFTITADGAPRKLQLSGAQDPDTFAEAFEVLLAQQTSAQSRPQQ